MHPFVNRLDRRLVTAALGSTLGLGLAVGLAAPARAEPERVPDQGLSLPRPAGLPDRLYGGDVYTTGGARGHVVIVESGDPTRPARWLRIEDDGAITWQADHRCPNFVDYMMLLGPEGEGAAGERAVCKVGRTVVGVDLTSGKEAWSFSDPSPLYMTVRGGDRVAVSVDNVQVAVLDVVSGKELMRLDVQGAVLEAATQGPKGPLAFFVKDSATAPAEYMELPVGEGDALEKVPLAGDDPGRTLVAIAIGGPAKKGIVKPKPLWSVPFEGWSYELAPTAGALIGEPHDGRVTGYDLTSGKVLWERTELDGELRGWGDEGGVLVQPLTGGGFSVAAIAARTGKPLWERRVEGKTALGVGAGDGDLGVVWETGFRLAAFADGAEKLTHELAPGTRFLALRTTPRSAVWVVGSGDTRELWFKRL